MNDQLTPERVVEAHAAREVGCVIRKEGAMSMAATDCIENRHFDIIDALCRRLAETLDVVWNNDEPDNADGIAALIERVTTDLALIPPKATP